MVVEIFAALQGGTVFSVDLPSAYFQLELDKRAQSLTADTHVGLIRFERLPYGVSCAPAMFQAATYQILHGLPGTGRYIDDI